MKSILFINRHAEYDKLLIYRKITDFKTASYNYIIENKNVTFNMKIYYFYL